MGSLDRYIKDSNTLYYYVSTIIGHINFDPRTFENDIALLLLVSEVPSNHPNVKPISLASLSPTEGQNCVISGWGRTSYEGSQPATLQAANVKINSRRECNMPNRYGGAVLNGMFCAGSFTGPDISDSW